MELNLTFDIEDATNLAGDNGSIQVNPIGGNGNFSYLWSTGSTDQKITGLSEGVYTVTVTDDNNCETIDSAEVIKFGCGDTNYASAGASSNYSNNEDRTIVICPDFPDEGVVLTFNLIEIETNWDALYIHNGNSTNAPLFDSGNGPTHFYFNFHNYKSLSE